MFILLSSRIEIVQIEKLGTRSLLLFAVVIFIIRPLGVWLSSVGSNLRWRETLFIAWIGPRGIVAAAVASLFSLDLINSTTNSAEIRSDAELLLPLVFLVIVGTVVIQGTSAKWIGKLLGVSHMVTGSIGKLGTTFTLDVRIFSVQDGGILNTVSKSYQGPIDGLLTQIEMTAWELIGLTPPAGKFPDAAPAQVAASEPAKPEKVKKKGGGRAIVNEVYKMVQKS